MILSFDPWRAAFDCVLWVAVGLCIYIVHWGGWNVRGPRWPACFARKVSFAVFFIYSFIFFIPYGNTYLMIKVRRKVLSLVNLKFLRLLCSFDSMVVVAFCSIPINLKQKSKANKKIIDYRPAGIICPNWELVCWSQLFMVGAVTSCHLINFLTNHFLEWVHESISFLPIGVVLLLPFWHDWFRHMWPFWHIFILYLPN